MDAGQELLDIASVAGRMGIVGLPNIQNLSWTVSQDSPR